MLSLSCYFVFVFLLLGYSYKSRHSNWLGIS